jgi:NitT/TauT family transport system permease protein
LPWFLAAVLTLELARRFGLVLHQTIIPPSEMTVALTGLIRTGRITADLTRTLTNVGIAFALSVFFGSLGGILIHGVPRLRSALDPYFASYYAVPFFVFYPVLIAMFGVTDAPIIIIAFMFSIVAMTVSTISALDRVPTVLLKAARVARMGPVATALRIKLPSALPQLFTGIKLAIAYSFIGVIASEFILSSSGLGYVISYSYNNLDNRTMYALMLLVVVLVTTINMTVYACEQRILSRRGLLQ